MKISVCLPTFNEAENIKNMIFELEKVFNELRHKDYEILIIDNNSSDNTTEIILSEARVNKKIKLIKNNRNFGHICSPFHGIINCSGDVVIYLASDFQDPPEMIPLFLDKWKSGACVVLGIKTSSDEGRFKFALRSAYYSILQKITPYKVTKNTTGFGLYDKKVIEYLRTLNDPRPYLRGLIDEAGFQIETLEFNQPKRDKGKSKNNIASLIDFAFLGVTASTLLPLRVLSLVSLVSGLVSLIFSLFFLIMKLFLWDLFSMGVAPLLIGLFFMFGVVLIFMGIIAEYLNNSLLYLRRRPLVHEHYRVNFDD
jgi:glycosyltransferase involved in cell wall biosynthesis